MRHYLGIKQQVFLPILRYNITQNNYHEEIHIVACSYAAVLLM